MNENDSQLAPPEPPAPQAQPVQPPVSKRDQHMMGRDPEEQALVDKRQWHAMKLAIWRSKGALEIATRQAIEIVSRCQHADGCAGQASETEPCRVDCPDREVRLSALVILNAARQLTPIDARRPANMPYIPPSREYFSDVLAELAAAQAEVEALQARLDAVASAAAELAPALETKETP